MAHGLDAGVPGARVPGWLNRTVLGAGLTSALGDFSYETTTVILPGFLAVLGVPAAALGVIEGAADAVAAFMKMGAGYLGDRLGHRKAIVVFGYALTPLGQALIAVALGWPLILAGRLIVWFGRGVRGPLRDAIVALSITPGTRGRAFGFHRAMDTLGAVVGPLLGVALLGWSQQVGWWSGEAAPFRFVLWLTLVPGMLATITFLTMVHDPRPEPGAARSLFAALRGLPVRFRRYLVAVGTFGAGDFSHTLLILAATDLLTPAHGVVRAAQIAGLLYVGRNLVQVLASYPAGALADRVGAVPVLVVGYALGVATALLTALAFGLSTDAAALLAAVFLCAGLYVAAQEALEPTVTAEIVESASLATGLGALGTVNGATKFVSSAGVGFIWSLASPAIAFLAAGALMATGTVSLASAARR